MDSRELAGLDVEHGDGVVLLQRYPSGFRVLGHGDVFGLDILSHRGARSKDAHRRVQFGVVELREGGRADVVLGQPANIPGQIDNTDRTFGVDGVVIVRLALVGDQYALTIRREGHHVGQRADLDGCEDFAIGIEENRFAWIGFGVRFHSGDDQSLVNIHAVDDTADVHAEQQRGGGGFARVEHVDLAALRVDHEQPLSPRIVSHDLGGRLVENARRVSADGRDADLKRRCFEAGLNIQAQAQRQGATHHDSTMRGNSHESALLVDGKAGHHGDSAWRFCDHLMTDR